MKRSRSLTETSGIKIIALNKKALHDYFIEQKFNAGLVLQGWEVKSLREGHVQLRDSYVLLKNQEAWLIGCHISPLLSASSHIQPDPTRTRKLLLNKAELNKLYGSVERKGFSLIPLKLYWQKGKAKCELALAKGKKEYDKRATKKEKDWEREKARITKSYL